MHAFTFSGGAQDTEQQWTLGAQAAAGELLLCGGGWRTALTPPVYRPHS